MRKEERIYPVIYDDKYWYEKDCDELFIDLYEVKEQLNPEGGIYMAEGLWLYPDGSMDYY